MLCSSAKRNMQHATPADCSRVKWRERDDGDRAGVEVTVCPSVRLALLGRLRSRVVGEGKVGRSTSSLCKPGSGLAAVAAVCFFLLLLSLSTRRGEVTSASSYYV